MSYQSLYAVIVVVVIGITVIAGSAVWRYADSEG